MSRDYLTIVSGLPRSGTSMMMRILGEGGIPILTDGLRVSDDDNPRGYFEFEPVKKLKDDSSWIASSMGKAVKMVHLLLLHLPLSFQYRVVFMRRNPVEVYRSQNQMLQRLQGRADSLPEQRVIEISQAQIETVLQHLRSHSDRFRLLIVDYNALMENPVLSVEQVSSFLDGLDLQKSLAVIDRSLYRQRVETV